MKYYPKIARRVSGVWASADGVALELRMDGRFEERHDGEIAFAGHYEVEGFCWQAPSGPRLRI